MQCRVDMLLQQLHSSPRKMSFRFPSIIHLTNKQDKTQPMRPHCAECSFPAIHIRCNVLMGVFFNYTPLESAWMRTKTPRRIVASTREHDISLLPLWRPAAHRAGAFCCPFQLPFYFILLRGVSEWDLRELESKCRRGMTQRYFWCLRHKQVSCAFIYILFINVWVMLYHLTRGVREDMLTDSVREMRYG